MSQASEISPEAVADGVFSVSLLSPARCRSVLDSVQDENHWEAAPIRKSVAGENRTVVEKNARNAESLGPNSHPRLLDEFEVVVKEQLLPFASRIFGVQVRDVRGTQLVRYRPGGYYHPHTDTTPSYFRTRYFTVLCYVNEDFQGGTTSFPLLDCVARYFHQELRGTVERIVGEPVKPSYCYVRSYLPGASQPVHTDREQCVWNVSWLIDDLGAAADTEPWPIRIMTDDSQTEVGFGVGEAVLFPGSVPHQRPVLPGNRSVTVIFFHYVPRGFTGSLN